MNTNPIQALKSNVSREDALRTFSAASPSALFWRIARGPLQRLADVYVPFSFYTVRYAMGKTTCKLIFAADDVTGSLDLFVFPQLPEPEQFVAIETRNNIPASLPDTRAMDLLHDKVLRLIFQQGFFRLRDPGLEITRERASVHIPYWLGFYGNGLLKCRALDAIRRRFEGAKASAFFEEWLAA